MYYFVALCTSYYIFYQHFTLLCDMDKLISNIFIVNFEKIQRKGSSPYDENPQSIKKTMFHFLKRGLFIYTFNL